MNLKDFTSFLKLPIAKLIIGFFFAVVIAQSYAIYTLHEDSTDLSKEMIECEKKCEVKMSALQTEIKEELRTIIKTQQEEIEKSRLIEEKAKQQQESAQQNKKNIEKIKHDFGI